MIIQTSPLHVIADQKIALRRCVIACVPVLLAGLLVGAARAESIIFDLASTSGSNQTGLDLDGLASGVSPVNGSTFTVTLNATAGVGGSGDVFNHTTSSPNFGINAPGSSDVADAFDGGSGMSQFMTFSVTSSIAAAYNFVAIDFDRITGSGDPGDDAGSLTFDGGNTLHFNGSNVDGSDLLTVGESFTAGQTITLAHVDGTGFGIEQIILDVVPVPEPSAAVILTACLLGLVPRRPTGR